MLRRLLVTPENPEPIDQYVEARPTGVSRDTDHVLPLFNPFDVTGLSLQRARTRNSQTAGLRRVRMARVPGLPSIVPRFHFRDQGQTGHTPLVTAADLSLLSPEGPKIDESYQSFLKTYSYHEETSEQVLDRLRTHAPELMGDTTNLRSVCNAVSEAFPLLFAGAELHHAGIRLLPSKSIHAEDEARFFSDAYRLASASPNMSVFDDTLLRHRHLALRRLVQRLLFTTTTPTF